MTSQSSTDRTGARRGLLVLVGLALARIAFHTATNGAYGWHRDELQMLADARHLDWGFVEYPPLAPLLARAGLALFGPSMPGVRLLSAVAQGATMVVAGLTAREFGGRRSAQVLAAVATALAPISLIQGAMFQYVSFDMLWWTLIAYFVVRLANTSDPRWWLGIGGVIGLGMQTKYTMAFCVAGVVAGVLATPVRRQLASPWLWAGVLLSIAIFVPNVVWQARHGFISLEFLNSIHARDVRIGRTDGFLVEQLYITSTPLAALLWIPGFAALALDRRFERCRMLAWMYGVPLVLFILAKGRGYYLGAAYPMLFAAGAVAWQHWSESWPRRMRVAAAAALWTVLVASGLAVGSLVTPVAPVHSAVWEISSSLHPDFREQLGWPELVDEVARIYHALPEQERAVTGIYASNYGEAGAIDLYGPARGLPPSFSGVNTYWLRGFPSPPPATLIVVGSRREDLERVFDSVDEAGRTPNPFDIVNEETRDHPVIYVCRGMTVPWPDVWAKARSFG